MNAVTIVGNLTADPELRFTSGGHPVASIDVAVSKRVKDNNEWKDELQGFFRVTCWRDLAENCAESLTKGMRVVVVGSLKESRWEKDGQKHSRVEIAADEVAPSLRFASAQIRKTERKQLTPTGGASSW
jgi:single-strand DNA-binding protein